MMIRLFLILIFVVFTNICVNAQQFSDVTSTSGLQFVAVMPDLFGSGASIADYDNDGDLDFFAGTEFGLTNLLYNNNGNGVFQEVAVASGITSTFRCRSSLWVDYNGDELLDLILLGDCLGIDSSCTDRLQLFLYQQTSSGNFVEITNSGLDFGDRYNIVNIDDPVVGGIAAGDVNNDGWLDIIITSWGRMFEGAKMSMFLNNTDGTFTDITDVSFPLQPEKSRYQPLFHDFNHDGFLDIYINVDFTENEFWLNNGNNTFQDISATINANSAFNEMGMAVGDYDNDGDFDLYSTNISREENGVLRHNIFLKNNWVENGSLGFDEVSNSPNLNVGSSGWDWGTTFFDANNDGYVDLAATNGWGQGWSADQSKLWLNVDGLAFSDISSSSGFNDTWDATSLMAFDMDRDGDLDLLQSMKQNGNNNNLIRIYENNYSSTTNANNYLVVKPRMNGSNHFAIGTVVKISYDNGKTGMRLITAGTSFYGQEPAEAFFGVVDNTIIDEIRIEWPDNTVTVVEDVASNQVITITNDNVLDVATKTASQVKAHPNPVKDILNLESLSFIESIEIYNLLGQSVFQKTISSTNMNLDMSSFESGSYFVKIIDANSKVRTIRVIKQ
ncbi:putative secreted protein (Por secretion system target) [Winogradskyella wandonensis]|uniref:Putative secreted protein (Por secretion system target) n=1 Tax=Winogradskyella wandonensis TaxID=1442586 RepID=A0A4R1KJR8_9FLAO|nr:FG-GAP-like repeat-containing protein [Winogradskyella wandonensis]TCK65015.1 putative secreted protein (Por secretion system target) [Winogradskyella wandonensis]